MVDPLDRYDTGHRPAVGGFTAFAQAEIDGIVLLTSDAVRQCRESSAARRRALCLTVAGYEYQPDFT